MRWLAVLVTVSGLVMVSGALGAQTVPRCQSHEALVYAAGCDGPGTLVCDSAASLPSGGEWCGCDGRTIPSYSAAPPSGVRYRFQGACQVSARFELTDERSGQGQRSGRVVVFVKVGNAVQETLRVAGPCREAPAQSGELARVVCGTRNTTTLAIRSQGTALVVSDGTQELLRTTVPNGQRVVGAAPQVF